MWEPGTGDADGDGWTNEKELYIGTDPFDDCADSSSDDAWPADIKIDRTVNILDILMFGGHMGCSIGQDCYDNRLDLNTDGTLNILDVLMLPPHYGTCT